MPLARVIKQRKGEQMSKQKQGKRTESIGECGCVLERTETGLHMRDCPLHAAAPELLEALKLAERFMSEYRNSVMTGSKLSISDYDCITALRDAIAKAEGGE